ncbi:MAG: DUF1295 domain-containing protein [Sandaracinaceae bacterium]
MRDDTALSRDRLWVVAVYLVALTVAALTYVGASGLPPLLRAFVADVAGTVVVFGGSVALRNSSVYDPYWSVAPPLLWAVWALERGVDARSLLVGVLVLAWGVRLTFNWARGWAGLQHEDWRYRDIRSRTGPVYWVVSFLGIHLMPTVVVFVGCFGLFVAASGGRPLGIVDALAALLTAGAIVLEAVADEQLRAYLARRPRPTAVMSEGVWSVSRHPNYLGEIAFWWGVWLFGVAARPDAWVWTLVGPATVTLLFLTVSLPMMEGRLAGRPGHDEYRRRVSILIPLPPRR